GLGDLAVGRDDDFAGFGIDDIQRDLFTQQDIAQSFRQLVLQFTELLLVLVFDLLGVTLLFAGGGAGALFAFFLGRHFNVHDDAIGARRNLERRVFHVGGFFTEDGAEQTFFRREFGFRLRCDFADEDVAGLHFGADADNTVRPEVLERFIA